MRTVSHSIIDLQAAKIGEDLGVKGFSVVDKFFTAFEIKTINDFLIKLKEQDALKKAAIGNAVFESVNTEVRGDYIKWIDFNEDTSLNSILKPKLEQLTLSYNRSLFLGIKDYEFHTTVYPIGARYKTHVDRFKNNSSRVLSMVIYLNSNWITGDGGELVIHNDNDTKEVIEPIAGRMVTFLSDNIKHEVLETKIERNSITGWFLDQPIALNFIRNY